MYDLPKISPLYMCEVSTGDSSPDTSMMRSGENRDVSLFIRKLKYLKRRIGENVKQSCAWIYWHQDKAIYRYTVPLRVWSSIHNVKVRLYTTRFNNMNYTHSGKLRQHTKDLEEKGSSIYTFLLSLTRLLCSVSQKNYVMRKNTWTFVHGHNTFFFVILSFT